MQQRSPNGEHCVRAKAPPGAALNGDAPSSNDEPRVVNVTPNVTTPRYRFLNENDEHLHTLDGRPLMGTSTVCNIIAKPLAWWAAGMAVAPLGHLNIRKSKIADRLKAAEEAQARIAAMTPREYAAFLEKDCYRAHNNTKEETAVEGTANHLCLENYVKECLYENGGSPIPASHAEDTEAVQIFATWAFDNVIEFLWSEAHCYSEELWLGGICDCGALLKTYGTAIIDFKRSKEPYYAQFLQCGGYAIQVKEHGLLTADGDPIKIGDFITGFGAFVVFPLRAGKVFVRRNTVAYENCFRGALSNYNLHKIFEASKHEEVA